MIDAIGRVDRSNHAVATYCLRCAHEPTNTIGHIPLMSTLAGWSGTSRQCRGNARSAHMLKRADRVRTSVLRLLHRVRCAPCTSAQCVLGHNIEAKSIVCRVPAIVDGSYVGLALAIATSLSRSLYNGYTHYITSTSLLLICEVGLSMYRSSLLCKVEVSTISSYGELQAIGSIVEMLP